MKMDDPYDPIACVLHDEYEIAIMHKKHLDIEWLDETGGLHSARVLPKDILVKNKEEFLLATTKENEELRIRLDKITIQKN